MTDHKIEDFLKTKPNIIDVIGYGSSVMHQNGYTEDIKRQIDMIVTVEDIKKFHQENFKNSPDEYSKLGFKMLDLINHIGTDINYISNIDYLEDTFKMGIINKTDLHYDIENWINFCIAGRLQKPVNLIKCDNELRNLIIKNRLNALRAALIIKGEENYTRIDLYEMICSLSYVGDIRLFFKCENPNKIKNIVSGSYDEFYSIYEQVNNNLFYTIRDKVYPNTEKLARDITDMPPCLVSYIQKKYGNLDNVSKNDLELIKNCICEYLKMVNIVSSIAQPLKSIVLNGSSKSINYLNEKIKKGKM